jgi:hypothetical protein
MVLDLSWGGHVLLRDVIALERSSLSGFTSFLRLEPQLYKPADRLWTTWQVILGASPIVQFFQIRSPHPYSDRLTLHWWAPTLQFSNVI